MKLPEQDVQLVQVNGIRRQVFIKLRNPGQIEEIITQNNRTLSYAHDEGTTANRMRPTLPTTLHQQ
jgi:DNA-binding sugar fermentation-stimulating protein